MSQTAMKAEKKEEDVHPVSIEVRERDDMVMLVFNKAVSWVGIEPVQAIRIAEQIRAAAVGVLRSAPRPGSG